jgi:hypothetical protein
MCWIKDANSMSTPAQSYQATTVQLPKAIEVTRYLTRFLRCNIEVEPMTAVAANALVYGGIYHAGDCVPMGACAADLGFAVYDAAALSMVPPAASAEQFKKHTLDAVLSENFAKVLNVLTRLFVVPNEGRVALLKTVISPVALPVAPCAAGTHADFAVEIPRYGPSVLSFRTMVP